MRAWPEWTVMMLPFTTNMLGALVGVAVRGSGAAFDRNVVAFHASDGAGGGCRLLRRTAARGKERDKRETGRGATDTGERANDRGGTPKRIGESCQLTCSRFAYTIQQ